MLTPLARAWRTIHDLLILLTFTILFQSRITNVSLVLHETRLVYGIGRLAMLWTSLERASSIGASSRDCGDQL